VLVVEFPATNNIHIIRLNNIVGVPTTTTINHSLFSGSCATLTNLYCSTVSQSVATGLTIGQTYYIRVYTAGNTVGNYANFTLCIQTPPPPATNDNCISAITAVVNNNSKCTQVTPGNIIGATASTPAIIAPCIGNANDDVWFKFTALSTIHYFNLLNVTGTTTNLNHAVYSGTCDNLTQLFCSTANNLASNFPSFVVGQTYYIRVWSNETLSQVTTFNLCIKSVSTCNNAEFLCGTTPNDPPYIIENTTGITPGAGNIACLFTTPNPTYYVLKIGQTGPVKFEIRQSTDINNFPTTGAPGIDVDFVAWGPFPDAQSCSQISLTSCAPCPNNTTNQAYYPSGNIVDCSYSGNPVETLTINNAQAGQFYVLLLTNFNGAAGYIKLIQTNTVSVPGQPVPGETICCDVKLGPDKNICGSNLLLNSLINVDPLTIPTSYKWYLNGVLIPGANSSTYTATVSGTYKVEGTCNQSTTTDEIIIKISPIVSLAMPIDYQLCDGLPANGFEVFNLLSRNTAILGALDPTKYTVSYHLTTADATDDINPISNAATYTNTVINTQIVYVRVESNDLNACFDVKPLKLVVSALANGSFTYPSNQFCKNQANPAPITLGQLGTVVIVPSSGLSINLTTLQINLALTTPGTYTITNTIPASGGCSVVVASTTITVYPESDILLESGCEGTKYVVVAKPVNNSFSLATATFAWAGPNFAAIAGRANAIEAKAAGNYTVTVTTPDGCKSIETINVASVLCQIQKGISPNGDGKNDSFDLTSLGVSKLEIFNRYGTLVYDLANYTNQWVGQSSVGGELPDGTYFYVIQKADGTPGITGWIYINR
jgi:gliding motility-associated-like protein